MQPKLIHWLIGVHIVGIVLALGAFAISVTTAHNWDMFATCYLRGDRPVFMIRTRTFGGILIESNMIACEERKPEKQNIAKKGAKL